MGPDEVITYRFYRGLPELVLQYNCSVIVPAVHGSHYPGDAFDAFVFKDFGQNEIIFALN